MSFVSVFCGPFAIASASAMELASAPVQRPGDVTSDDIIIHRVSGLGARERGRLRLSAGVAHVRKSRLRDVELARAAPGQLRAALARLNADKYVRFAEPNTAMRAQTNDAYWSLLWGLSNTGQSVAGTTGTAGADIDAPQAWALSRGAGQRVAVVDTGASFAHADLAGQFGVNAGESSDGKEDNAIDDDANGYVDDYRGWDFVGADNDPADANGHGTHVSGTIVAVMDNGAGIAGVAPLAKVYSLRALDAGGSGTALGVAEAFDLAGAMGIAIVNASLGGGYSQTQRDVIAAHRDTLYVVAAGNGGSDAIGDDNDSTPMYPCAFDEANVVCVGASTASDARASFSNYGATTVDVFAPGVNIASAWIDAPDSGCAAPCYVYSSGTSMAAPHVAGILALMRATTPVLSAAQLKAALLASGDIKPGLVGTSVTGARANAHNAVTAALDPDDDGVPDFADNCPSVANAGQGDLDDDGVGDACDADRDGDAIADVSDNCPSSANAGQGDLDGDGVGDGCDADRDGDAVADVSDNCPALANVGQGDLDGDGLGDACDPDRDGDAIADVSDNCPAVANAGQGDLDDNGLGDACDADRDADTIANPIDNCPSVANAGQGDLDSDSVGDACDATVRGPDSDGDGVYDRDDNCPSAANAEQADRDADAIGDVCDLSPVVTVTALAPQVNPPVLPGPQVKAPVLLRPSLNRSVTTRARPARLRFALDRAATVRLTVKRRLPVGYRTVGSVRLAAAARTNRFTLSPRFGTRLLRPGRYRLTVIALDGRLASRTYKLHFTVRTVTRPRPR